MEISASNFSFSGNLVLLMQPLSEPGIWLILHSSCVYLLRKFTGVLTLSLVWRVLPPQSILRYGGYYY